MLVFISVVVVYYLVVLVVYALMQRYNTGLTSSFDSIVCAVLWPVTGFVYFVFYLPFSLISRMVNPKE